MIWPGGEFYEAVLHIGLSRLRGAQPSNSPAMNESLVYGIYEIKPEIKEETDGDGSPGESE